MKKLNNRGFSVSGILYPLFLLFLTLVILILFNITQSRVLLTRQKEELIGRINDEPVGFHIKTPGDQIIGVGTELNLMEGVEALGRGSFGAKITYTSNPEFNSNIEGTYVIAYTAVNTLGMKTYKTREIAVMPSSYNYSYNGNYQKFKAPVSGYYKLEAWGAQGHGSQGKGAYTGGDVYLEKGEEIYVYVGQGLLGTANGTSFNGGTGDNGGQAGGGATDFRFFGSKIPTTEQLAWNNLVGLRSRIMVAGGSGSGSGNSNINLGSGGKLVGLNGGVAKGGTQTAGGERQATSYVASSFGIGNGGCAGGGGYYGGGGSSCANGGGGGSSYIAGFPGTVSVKSSDDTMPTYVSKIDFDIQYIEVGQYGSSANGGNHIVELQAFDLNNTNVALNKTVTATAGSSLTRITDGNLDSAVYADNGTGAQSITVDLGSEQKLNSIKLYRYYADARTYYQTYTKVYNSDKTKSAYVHNYEIDGTYPDNFLGKEFYINQCITGNEIEECSTNYTTKKFINGTMRAGNEVMPSQVSGTQTGNAGNGYAKITYIGKEISTTKQYDYYYSGSHEEFTAPVSGYYQLEAWGAQGGGAAGGKGAYSSGKIYLKKNEKIYVYVGQSFTEPYSAGVHNGYSTYNGGGSRGGANGQPGGGATDFRLVEGTWNDLKSLSSRIMVAGGGGGISGGNCSYAGGNAGSLVGTNGVQNSSFPNGKGGSQIEGGAQAGDSLAASFGIGSYGGKGLFYAYNYRYPWGAGGGGGGYYGGSGGSGVLSGSTCGSGGGGGSSYISGHTGSIAIKSENDQTPKVATYSKIEDSYHYSGKVFVDTKMKAGNEVLPTTAGGTQTGNAGNGYARIIYVGQSIPNTYEYTGNYQEFIAEESGTYSVQLWGAQGGTYSSYIGGRGGYSSGEIYLTEGTKLYVYVGGAGSTPNGGWNGGGNASNDSSNYNRGGGGATDIRVIPTSNKNSWNDIASLKSRIMIAAGGGGSGSSTAGGAGGGLIGISGSASGGKQTKGVLGTGNGSGFGYGANGYNLASGGGGGYYGGGQQTYCYACAGGGGSSYISGYEGSNSVNSDNIHTGSSLSYTGYYFINTTMKNGNETVPTYDGNNTMTGNTGHGYAQITLIKKGVKEAEEITKEKNEILKNNQFTSSNNYQIFKVPFDGKYKIELWGAQGGSYSPIGGKGGYTAGEISLKKGTELYIYVGGAGETTNGGWNGGGNASNDSSNYNRGGGGATDIRIIKTSSSNLWNETESINSRLMVAAGGGGSGNTTPGGAGGGLIGISGSASGGTQISGVTGTSNSSGFGFGANGYNLASGGGGGYYGGGQQTYCYACAGGGGSSYISGYEGCIAIKSASDRTPKVTTYSKIEDSYHYSNYIFLNSVMKTGNEIMPNPLGETMTGNTGDGYARIMYIGS